MYVGNLILNYLDSSVRLSKGTLYSELQRMIPSINSINFYKAINDVGEIYYFKHIDENNIIYVTKDKYAYAVANCYSLTALSLNRKMSIGKFFKDHLPEISETTINACIEYNKMLTSYNPSLLSIVSGDDIIKYYLQNSYFRATGELGSSCMRDSSKSDVIKFYANNSNFKLLIMKAGETDSIMARALLVTTTDGTVFMDRVYTVDTKLISLFHRYAKENDIKNIYEYRESYGTKNLLSQGPGNWTKEYNDNYKVNLDWLPIKIANSSEAVKYAASIQQHSNITSGYDLPYIDNFQYVNAFTRQASVNALNFFAACDLSGELIDNNNVYYYDNKIYDKRFVDISPFIAPTLKIDTVTLDSPSTLQSADDDIDEDLDEDIDWGESDLDSEQETEENPYTIEAARLLGISPELQSGLGVGGIISVNTPSTPESTTTLINQLYDGLIVNDSRYRVYSDNGLISITTHLEQNLI